MDKNDFIFGSHRSHGEVIAKGLSAIEKLSEDELISIMESYFDGAILKVVEGKQKKKGNVKELAIDFSYMEYLQRFSEGRQVFKKAWVGQCMCSSHRLEFIQTTQ